MTKCKVIVKKSAAQIRLEKLEESIKFDLTLKNIKMTKRDRGPYHVINLSNKYGMGIGGATYRSIDSIKVYPTYLQALYTVQAILSVY